MAMKTTSTDLNIIKRASSLRECLKGFVERLLSMAPEPLEYRRRHIWPCYLVPIRWTLLNDYSISSPIDASVDDP